METWSVLHSRICMDQCASVVMLDLDRLHDDQYLFEKTCLIGEKVSWQVKVFPLRSTSLDIGAHRRMAAPLLRWTRMVFFVSSGQLRRRRDANFSEGIGCVSLTKQSSEMVAFLSGNQCHPFDIYQSSGKNRGPGKTLGRAVAVRSDAVKSRIRTCRKGSGWERACSRFGSLCQHWRSRMRSSTMLARPPPKGSFLRRSCNAASRCGSGISRWCSMSISTVIQRLPFDSTIIRRAGSTGSMRTVSGIATRYTGPVSSPVPAFPGWTCPG